MNQTKGSDMTTLKIKLSPDYPREWGPPAYATEGAACFDLRALDAPGYQHDFNGEVVQGLLKQADQWKEMVDRAERELKPRIEHSKIYRTGISCEVPEGHVLLIFSRSGHGFKAGVRLANCVGVIDSDFRGEILVKLTKDDENSPPFKIYHGDRIAQALLLPIPKVEIEIAEELSETVRGSGGFGSTGAAWCVTHHFACDCREEKVKKLKECLQGFLSVIDSERIAKGLPKLLSLPDHSYFFSFSDPLKPILKIGEIRELLEV